MKTANKTKTMIEKMRDIRDQISLDIMNMSVAEEKAYLADQLQKLKTINNKNSNQSRQKLEIP